MSNRALNWAFDAPIGNVGAKFVLVVLADHAGDHDGEDWVCFPSMNRIGEATSQSVSTLQRHLKWLVEAGWISRRRRILRKKEASVYEYTLHRDRLSQPPVKLTGDGDARPPVNLTATTGQNDRFPPDPPYIAEPSVTPTSARACEEAFKGLRKAWIAASPGRFSPVLAKRAFEDAARRCDPARIAEAGMRYLANDPDVKRLKQPILLHKWLDEDRFEPWLGAGDPAPPRWEGPLCVRERLVADRGEGFAVSYLDRATWDAGAGRVIPANSVAAKALAGAGVDIASPET